MKIVDRRRKYIAHRLDRAELERRVLAHPDYQDAHLELVRASNALAKAKERLAEIWDGEAAKLLGRDS